MYDHAFHGVLSHESTLGIICLAQPKLSNFPCNATKTLSVNLTLFVNLWKKKKLMHFIFIIL